MNIAHRIALDATAEQRAYFERAAGTKRFVWNLALEAWNKAFSIASGTPAGETAAWPSGYSLRKTFNKTKYQDHPWLKGVHRDAHSAPFADLQVAWSHHWKGLAKKPAFKKKGRCRDSFYVNNYCLRVEALHVRLPKIGWVRMCEPLRFAGKIMSATVSRTADRWFISFAVETDCPRPIKLKADGSQRRSAALLPETARRVAVGVDLGITHVAVTSAGVVYDAPKPLKKALRKLARQQRAQARKLDAGRAAQPDDRCYRSSNWRKASVRLARLHARVANVRLDFTHKLTTDLCRENQAVAIEDLNVSGMLKNRSLSRAISDVGWGEFRRQLTYKAPIYGTRLVVADRFYPSSKTCSACGVVKDKLSLSEREFACEACGLTIDRDLNAALNLEQLTYPGLPGNQRLRTGRKGTGSQDAEQPSLVEAETGTCSREHTPESSLFAFGRRLDHV